MTPDLATVKHLDAANIEGVRGTCSDDFRKTGFRIMKAKDFESLRGSHLIIIHEDIIAAA